MSTHITLPQLPPMRCDRGCGDCCGVVPVGAREFQRIAAVVKARGITPVRQGMTCPLYIDGVCSIYEARPRLCRIYGHSPTAPCSRGYNVNISEADEAAWQRAIARDSVPAAHIRWIHELCFSAPEVGAMLTEYMATGDADRGRP